MPSQRRRLIILTVVGRYRKCSYCKEQINVTVGPILVHDWHLATIDHILPRALGGDESIQNIRLACMWCNTGRSITGHCVAALRCAEAVVGRGNMAAVAQWSASTQVIKDNLARDSSAGCDRSPVSITHSTDLVTGDERELGMPCSMHRDSGECGKDGKFAVSFDGDATATVWFRRSR